MNTDPQSPQGSPSEARGSQSPSPIWVGCKGCGGSFNIASVRLCPACHPAEKLLDKSPTPAGSEGRQSPGPGPTIGEIILDCMAKDMDATRAALLAMSGAPVPAGLEEARTLISDWLRLDFDWRRHSDDKAMNQEWVNEISAVHERARALAAPGAPQGEGACRSFYLTAGAAFTCGRCNRPKSEHDEAPSQEEGPAGVDLCPICDSAMDSLPNTRLACPRNPECPMPIVWRSDLPKIRRLRAPAPASSPRDLEAATIRTALHLGMSQADPKERVIFEAALEALAHPPQGETPSEAAGDLEAKLDRLCESVKHWAQNGMTADLLEVVEWNRASILSARPPEDTPIEAARLPVGAVATVEDILLDHFGTSPRVECGNIAEEIVKALSSHAPGTPIEKAAREAALEKLAKLALKVTGGARGGNGPRDISIFDLADLDIAARASLSSLPQEGSGAEFVGHYCPAVGFVDNRRTKAQCPMCAQEGAQEPKEGGAA